MTNGRAFSKLMLPVAFVLWFAFLSMTSHVFLTWQNLFNVSRQVAVVGILSLAQFLCVLTGNVDLSIGTFVGLFGALLAGLSLQTSSLPAIAIALAVAVAWGSLNGFLVTRGEGISVIVTLSTMYIARGLTLIYTDGHPIINFPMPYEFLGVGNLGPVPWSFILLSVVALTLIFVLRFTPTGRHLYAVGGNRQAARVCGVHVKRLTAGVYVSSAILAAMGSIVLLGRVASAQPNAGVGMELDSIAAVLIGGASMSGGRGSVIMTLIGTFMLGFINNGLNLLGVSGYYQFVFKGAIVLVAVLIDNLQKRNE